MNISDAFAPYVAPLVSGIVGLLGVLSGVLLAHRFTSERERVQKRRELLLKHLIEIWFGLEEGNRDDHSIEMRKLHLENAISMIKIFGSVKQIKEANIFTEDMASNSFANLTPLVISIRNSIREQIRLEEFLGPINWLRITLKKSSATETP